MAISFQFLFIIVSGVIFAYIKSRSFKFYMLYNLFLLMYLLSRNDVYYYKFESIVAYFIGNQNSEIFTHISTYYSQVIFYNFYAYFALYFLDLDKRAKKLFQKVDYILKFLAILFLFFAVTTYLLENASLFISLYTFIYLPAMLTIFAISLIRANKVSGKHKHFFLTGVSVFVCFALTAFAGSFIPSLHIQRPITFFYVGIVIETIFFSLGLAYKIKLMNDEKNRVRSLVVGHRHQQEISKLQGLLEGEEKERKRIAEELHDGIACDLSAIKINLNCLDVKTKNSNEILVLQDLSKIIDRSCEQIREISHNLSPSSINNFGILGAAEKFCKKVESTYNIKINFSYSGEPIKLTKTIETHIYRIIQELVTNVVKHSEATTAEVKIIFNYPFIEISVKDDGKGFVINSLSKGIGLSNIDSRVRFMNAKVTKESNETGTQFKVLINCKDISEN